MALRNPWRKMAVGSRPMHPQMGRYLQLSPSPFDPPSSLEDELVNKNKSNLNPPLHMFHCHLFLALVLGLAPRRHC